MVNALFNWLALGRNCILPLPRDTLPKHVNSKWTLKNTYLNRGVSVKHSDLVRNKTYWAPYLKPPLFYNQIYNLNNKKQSINNHNPNKKTISSWDSQQQKYSKNKIKLSSKKFVLYNLVAENVRNVKLVRGVEIGQSAAAKGNVKLFGVRRALIGPQFAPRAKTHLGIEPLGPDPVTSQINCKLD